MRGYRPDPIRLMSAASVLESALIVEARRGEVAGRELDLFLHRAGVTVAPVDLEHVEAARHAWRQYGKGHHPASLNFGDCLSYALAVCSGEPLLFKGEDFSLTAIRRVV